MEPQTSKFEMLAKMNGMSPRAFRMYCKSRAGELRQAMQEQGWSEETSTGEREREEKE